VPAPSLSRDYLIAVLAVFGTTVAPYLMFWQALQEVDEIALHPESQALMQTPATAPAEIRRIWLDTYLGIAAEELYAHPAVEIPLNALGEKELCPGLTSWQEIDQACEEREPGCGRLSWVRT
jgi:hypothetical protein